MVTDSGQREMKVHRVSSVPRIKTGMPGIKMMAGAKSKLLRSPTIACFPTQMFSLSAAQPPMNGTWKSALASAAIGRRSLPRPRHNPYGVRARPCQEPARTSMKLSAQLLLQTIPNADRRRRSCPNRPL